MPALLLLTGCFEEPVVERLALRFRADGAVEVAVTTELRADLQKSDPGSPLGRRLRETERALLAGDDDWSRRFAAVEPLTESYRWDKEEGFLARVERRALVADPGRLEDLFADTVVLADYLAEEGWAELGLYPGSPGAGASRKQQRQMEEALDAWSESLAVYLAAAEELYRYLERYPGRASPALSALFADLFDDLDPQLSEEEEGLVDLVDEAMGEVLEVLAVKRGEAYSLNELSRLVYDPFPAPVTVEVPGEILELEGFQVAPGRGRRRSGARASAPSTSEGGTKGLSTVSGDLRTVPRGASDGGTVLTVPGLGLWAALGALEGWWLGPDPALAYVRMVQLADDEAAMTAELAAFLAAPRHVEPAPDAEEAEGAIEILLRAEPAYRVVWRTEGGTGSPERP